MESVAAIYERRVRLRKISDVLIFSRIPILHRVDGHRRPILYSRSYHNILFDFERSATISHSLPPHVFYLSYPHWRFISDRDQSSKDAGFHLAVTTVEGR